MPETRYTRVFKDSVEQEPEPHEVSDEQLQAEADEARLKEIFGMSHSAIKVPALAEGFKLLCKKLGIA